LDDRLAQEKEEIKGSLRSGGFPLAAGATDAQLEQALGQAAATDSAIKDQDGNISLILRPLVLEDMPPQDIAAILVELYLRAGAIAKGASAHLDYSQAQGVLTQNKANEILNTANLAQPGTFDVYRNNQTILGIRRDQHKRLNVWKWDYPSVGQEWVDTWQAEKTALDGQLKDTEGKLKDAEGKLDDVRRQAGTAARKATGLEKELAAEQADKEALTAKLADAEQKLTRLSEQQRATEAERKRLDALAAQQKQSIASCEAKNENLHKQGVELLEKYQSKSCFETVLQGEPFTGLKQVEIENFVEDNREKLDEQKLDRQTNR